MEIQLDRIAGDSFSWTEELAIEASELDHPDLLGLSPVRLAGRLDRSEGQWLMSGRLQLERTLGCVRCLEPTRDEVEATLHLLVEVAPGRATGHGGELEHDDLGLVALAEPILDTRPIVIEQIQLDIPMKPLCRSDCLSLCPQCGAQRNDDARCCEPEIDPRWAGLAALASGGGSPTEH
ncbi:MAG: DUF177 domain-containing protein [Acidobacteriota bacterium]